MKNFLRRIAMKFSIGGVSIGRDAVTGRFVPVQVAKRRKATTVVETLKVKRDRNGRFAAKG